MQREKLYNLQTKVYCNYTFFIFKKWQNIVRPTFAITKTDRKEFGAFFKHNKYTNKISCSMSTVELFMLIFCLLKKIRD